MKTIFTAVAICLFLAHSGYAQEPCTRHTEAAGRFSYCPPTGWGSKDSTSSPYKTFLSASGATPRANTNVREEATTLSHNDYVAAALKYLFAGQGTGNVQSVKVVGWTDFTTDSKLRGTRLVYETVYSGGLLHTVQYMFDRPGKKLIVTGTAGATDKAAADVIFDNMLKTLRTF